MAGTPRKVLRKTRGGGRGIGKGPRECIVCGFMWMSRDVAVDKGQGKCICRWDWSPDEETEG